MALSPKEKICLILYAMNTEAEDTPKYCRLCGSHDHWAYDCPEQALVSKTAVPNADEFQQGKAKKPRYDDVYCKGVTWLNTL